MKSKKCEIIVETFRGVPTQLPISQLLTTLVNHTWYQNNAKTYEYCNRPTLYPAIFIVCQDAPRAAGKEIRLSQEKSVGSADFKPY